MATRQLAEAWSGLCDEMLHQGSVYGVSSAAIPHLIDVAPHLPAASRGDLWIEIGFLITAGADRFPSPPAPGLQEGVTAALGAAEALAVRDFLADAGRASGEDCYYALACVALAGHRVGRAMWQFPSANAGYVRVDCPGCKATYTVDGFADPLALPCPVPAFGPAPGSTATWRDAASAIELAGRGQVLGPGWDGVFDTARRVALAGVPPQAPPRVVWCLVAAMVATRSEASAPWARTLARLAGHVRCPGCDRVWAIADAMGGGAGAEPVSVTDDQNPDGGLQGVLFQMEHDGGTAGPRSGRVWAAAVADEVAGFPPAPGRRLASARVASRVEPGCEERMPERVGRDGPADAGAADDLPDDPPGAVPVQPPCPARNIGPSVRSPVASEIRTPFSASKEIGACSAGEPSPPVTGSAPSSLRSSATAWDSQSTRGRRTCAAGE